MRRTHWYALILICAIAVPSLCQQKTFNWVAGNDETVSLDPGYYHGGPAFQPSAQAPGAQGRPIPIVEKAGSYERRQNERADAERSEMDQQQ